MSKAETYAGMLDHHYSSNTEKNIAAHLRALDASRQRLKDALEAISNDYADRFDLDSPSTNPGIKYVIEQARAALEQAKDLL